MIEIAGRQKQCRITLSAKESPAVKRAAEHLCRDLERVCGCDILFMNECREKTCNIYIGTIGLGGPVDEKIAAGELKTEAIRTETGSYQWEGFVQQELDNSLYIAGVGRRGTVFGIYELCRMAGVSPWYYFADVPIKKKDRVMIPEGFYRADYPSVQYRGIFLNDEEELNAWSKAHTKDDTIGPETYEHIFELLLRLKANYIWPAMHVNYFNGDPRNGALAEEMGIVVGTSHCDMLLRSNQNEWHPWLESKGYENIAYDYSIPGENREKLKEYWRESVELNRDYEVCYTVGMRGIHDTGFVTQHIDQDENLSESEKRKAKVKLLGKVIEDQREILREVLGEERSRHALQTFVPYKEVLPLYDDGLELPDDVTLIWVDDNHGYMRRYPNEEERMRSGGHGLYYHNSYWAPPPMSYLFLNSIPLAHTGMELRKSYESGIRKIWVLNVGALKPLEQDIEFFLQTGWEVGKKGGLTEDTSLFTEHWINENFSGNHGKEVADLYDIFAQVTNVRKVEHMDTGIFSQTSYGNEAGRRLQRLEAAFHQANRIYGSLPEEEKPAFFEIFLMKLHASYLTNCEFYYADRSRLAYGRGNMQAADEALSYSRSMLDFRRWMIHFYNKVMMDGKWDRILTPESFPPPVTSMYPACRPALVIGEPELTVSLWNQAPGENMTGIRFSPYGRRRKYIELGNSGCRTVKFSIEIPDNMEWLHVRPVSGEVRTEQSVAISVPDPVKYAGEKGSIKIVNRDTGRIVEVPIVVEAALAEAEDGCYMEADGYISIPADGFSENHRSNLCCAESAGETGWMKVDYIGRGGGNAMMAHNPRLQSLEILTESNPYLEYDFYMLHGGEALLEVYRFLTLDSKGSIRLGVRVDDNDPVILESDIRDEWLGDWKHCVMSNGEKLCLRLPMLLPGRHKLKIYMIDNYVTVSKLVIYTEEVKESCLGPEWSRRAGFSCQKEPEEQPAIDIGVLRQNLETIYGCCLSETPLPNVVYAAEDFWKKDILYMENEEYPQLELGRPRYYMEPDGKKDIISQFGMGVFEEKDGVLALEAEYALEMSPYAWLTKSRDGKNIDWTHLQAETDGRTGLAMQVGKRGLVWSNPEKAPGMHYKIYIQNPGKYRIWLLLRFFDEESDSCYLALDGRVQPLEEQFSGGNLFTYSTTQVYFWSLISTMDIEAGIHTFSIYAAKSGLRIDRMYLTQGEERPWMDREWRSSVRRQTT